MATYRTTSETFDGPSSSDDASSELLFMTVIFRSPSKSLEPPIADRSHAPERGEPQANLCRLLQERPVVLSSSVPINKAWPVCGGGRA